MTDVVVAAHDEAEHLGAVLDAITSAPYVSRTIVAADSCTDATVELALAHGVSVLNGQWSDKGSAMAAGLAYVTTPDVLFCDGDLEGLTAEHVELLCTLPPEGGQVVGIPENDTAGPWPSLSGERRLPTEVALGAGLAGSSWRAETRLNVAVARAGIPWRHYVLRGVRNPPSWHPVSWPQYWAEQLAHLPELARYALHPEGWSLTYGPQRSSVPARRDPR